MLAPRSVDADRCIANFSLRRGRLHRRPGRKRSCQRRTIALVTVAASQSWHRLYRRGNSPATRSLAMDTTAIGSTIPCADGALGLIWAACKRKKRVRPSVGQSPWPLKHPLPTLSKLVRTAQPMSLDSERRCTTTQLDEFDRALTARRDGKQGNHDCRKLQLVRNL